MYKEEFYQFCEHFDFSKYPEAYQQFITKQIIVMKRYINEQRNKGDKRSENDILIEWIGSKNSSLFRMTWVLEYCNGEKINENEYNIPEHFYVKKR